MVGCILCRPLSSRQLPKLNLAVVIPTNSTNPFLRMAYGLFRRERGFAESAAGAAGGSEFRLARRIATAVANSVFFAARPEAAPGTLPARSEGAGSFGFTADFLFADPLFAVPLFAGLALPTLRTAISRSAGISTATSSVVGDLLRRAGPRAAATVLRLGGVVPRACFIFGDSERRRGFRNACGSAMTSAADADPMSMPNTSAKSPAAIVFLLARLEARLLSASTACSTNSR